jgi:hypothetical protein
MAIPNLFNTSSSAIRPTGTLETQGLYTNPVIPRVSQAGGMQGTDNRAYTRNVGQNELSVTHLNQMTNGNDPYMQNARQRGLESAARRGMPNSSIAAGASQRAALEAAAPFAMQAANAYGQAQSENMGALNTSVLQERDIMNRALWEANENAAARDGSIAMSQALSDAEQQRYRMFQENLAFEGEQRGLDRAHDFGRAEQGYGHDLGRMGSEFGYDVGRMGYGAELTGRENDRQYFRDIGRDNNTYANRRNEAILSYGLGSLTDLRRMQIGLLEQDQLDPTTINGIGQFMGDQGEILLSRFLDFIGIDGGNN